MIERYAHSGRFGAMALVLGLLGGVAAAAALSWPYQAVVDWIPLVYLEFLGTIGFGIAIGWVIARGLRRGKCRSRPLLIASVALAVVVGDALSFHWAYERFVAKVQEEAAKEVAKADEEGVRAPTLEEVREEIGFGAYLDLRLEEGWSIGLGSRGGLPISGLLVWLVWLAELGILAYFAWGKAAPGIEGAFCEACDAWAQPTELRPVTGVNGRFARAAAASEDLAFLLAPEPGKGGAAVAQQVLRACPHCDAAWLDLLLVEPKGHDKKGQLRTEITMLAAGVVLTPAQADELEERSARPPVKVAAPTPAVPPAPPKAGAPGARPPPG